MTGELRLYEIFYTVAQYQSFSKAAEALYISQPAISKAVRSLEEYLAVQLFIRTPKGIVLTPEGTTFLAYVEQALETIKAGQQQLDKLKHLQDGQLHLGVSSTLGTYFLLPRLKEFTTSYPHIKLHLTNDSTTSTLALVQKGQLDLALVSSYPYYEDLCFLPIKCITDIFVCSPAYYEQIRDFTLDELCQKGSFLFQSTASVSRLHLETVLKEKALTIHPNIVAGDMYFLVQCAKLGLGITPVVKDFVTDELAQGSLVQVHLLDFPERHIGIVTHPDFALSLAAKTFIDYLKQDHHYLSIKNNP